jgi:hypothetical protein
MPSYKESSKKILPVGILLYSCPICFLNKQVFLPNINTSHEQLLHLQVNGGPLTKYTFDGIELFVGRTKFKRKQNYSLTRLNVNGIAYS